MDIEDIYKFLEQTQGLKRKQMAPSVDLNYDLGIEGDDFFELEEEFSKKYNVNMDSYRWYFHHGEEGWSIGSLFSPAPYQQVEHIPVTPEILLQAAKTKSWPVRYPEHSITSRTVEFSINKLALLISLIFIALCILYKIA